MAKYYMTISVNDEQAERILHQDFDVIRKLIRQELGRLLANSRSTPASERYRELLDIGQPVKAADPMATYCDVCSEEIDNLTGMWIGRLPGSAQTVVVGPCCKDRVISKVMAR